MLSFVPCRLLHPVSSLLLAKMRLSLTASSSPAGLVAVLAQLLSIGGASCLAAGSSKSVSTASEAASTTCKCFPGDSCWPSDDSWATLNETVGGRLIKTVPLARTCHDPVFDNATCSTLQDGWENPTTHMDDPSSVMAPFFANQSCDPFTAESRTCEYGNYARYAVNVSTSDDVVAAISFAQANNIRLVIRNTGHDYLGRSTGAGSLSVWTYHLKDIDLLDWDDEYYTGAAIKVGAGAQGFDVLAATKDQGMVVVGGECPTVGIAGGYAQGGGHSALSTNFGLAADNVLAWEAVTADGRVVTASRTNNTDLYWALSGGGAGNYAVVLSMTAKTFPDANVGGATLTFYAATMSNETFYSAINAFHKALPAMVDAGSMVVYYFTSAFFSISPLTAYNKTDAEVQAILAPYLATLDTLSVNYTAAYTQSATYYDHYDTYFGPLPDGAIDVGIAQYGGRLIPRAAVEAANTTAFDAAVRFIAEQGVTFIGVGTNVNGSSTADVADQNGVLPAWRDALVHATLTTVWSSDPADWDQMLANQDLMTDVIAPAIEAVTPGSGAYMNEGDFRQKDFETVFFGDKYDKLLAIKEAYDPDSFFYATKAVGSDAWTVAEDGRMCKA